MDTWKAAKGRTQRVLAVIAFALAAAVVMALLSWHQGDERRALAALPAGERAAIYAMDLESFQSLCGRARRPDALERACREKAEFMLLFPECDQACGQLARDHLFVGPR